MPHRIETVDRKRILIWEAPAGTLASEADVSQLLAAAWENDVDWVAVETATLHDNFFRLETRLAGDVLQKMVNYGVKLTVVGDITPWLERSNAFRAFVAEANRQRPPGFVASLDSLLAGTAA
ncbi:DUF4180 domain-containing protein [Pandoraea pulmonicola]|uniref:DUF4180 domain-containing protein n=1 Tax=Pandoraea pulmonicola TaxID=93221 RepID=A0AAJ4ZFR9_PANPU|nr:DUF4180 domain-containing protein [Pandoraea pulmonicola]AJC19471.1 hypothetical protein RO07_01345 [Pandoraea pulmonicola]SUA92490.1 Uncharacterised protein [Pandoraea pulmonicola]